MDPGLVQIITLLISTAGAVVLAWLAVIQARLARNVKDSTALQREAAGAAVEAAGAAVAAVRTAGEKQKEISDAIKLLERNTDGIKAELIAEIRASSIAKGKLEGRREVMESHAISQEAERLHKEGPEKSAPE